MDLLEKPQIIPCLEKCMNHSIFDCKWVPNSAKIAVVGSQTYSAGSLDILEVSEDVQRINTIQSIETRKGIKCCTFGASDPTDWRMATGDFSGELNIWNIETQQITYTGNGHTEIINAIDGIGGAKVNCGAPEIVTGSRDGAVKLWDPRQKEIPVVSMEPYEGEERRDCWTVGIGNSYNNAERIICAGFDNGDIKMFDLRTMSMRWECNLRNGVCCLEFDRKDIPMNKFVATTLEGKFHVFDTRTEHPTKGFPQSVKKDNKNSTIWYCKHLPQNREIFATCVGSGHIDLWKYCYPEQRSKVDSKGQAYGVPGTIEKLQSMLLSSQGINSLDFSPDDIGLGICTSYDQVLRMFITTRLDSY